MLRQSIHFGPEMHMLLADYVGEDSTPSDLATMLIAENHQVVDNLTIQTLPLLTRPARQLFPTYLIDNRGFSMHPRVEQSVRDKFTAVAEPFEKRAGWLARLVFCYGLALDMLENGYRPPPVQNLGSGQGQDYPVSHGTFDVNQDLHDTLVDFAGYLESPNVSQLTGMFIHENLGQLLTMSSEDCWAEVTARYSSHPALITRLSGTSAQYSVARPTYQAMEQAAGHQRKALSWVARTATLLGLAQAMEDEHYIPDPDMVKG